MPARTVWTPDRDSEHAMVFMSVLRLRAGERWEWAEQPAQASLWLVEEDGNHPAADLLPLYHECGERPVAFLGKTLLAKPHPSWTFFRQPLQAPVLQRWLDAQGGRRPAASAHSSAEGSGPVWRSGLMQLSRWPNVSQYGTGLEVALTCSNLLRAPHRYQEALAWGMPSEQLDRLLSDMYAIGVLLVEAEPEIHTPLPEPATGGNWSLIRRVLNRFSRR